MDILRVLSASDLEVRRKTLDLTMDLVSSRNVEEVNENMPLYCKSHRRLVFNFSLACMEK